MNDWVLWISIGLMIIGIIGTLAPFLPGTPLIFAGALIYGIYDDFQHLSLMTTGVLFLLMLISILVEYFSGVVGAKSFGASKYGNWGALIGGLTSIFWLPFGLILGPLIGAVIGELYYRKDFNTALRAGFGTLAGLLGGAILKLIIAIVMVITFLVKVF